MLCAAGIALALELKAEVHSVTQDRQRRWKDFWTVLSTPGSARHEATDLAPAILDVQDQVGRMKSSSNRVIGMEIHLARRMASVLVALVVSVAGCGQGIDKESSVEVRSAVAADRFKSNGRWPFACNIKNFPIYSTGWRVPIGAQMIQVEVKWSNRYEDITELDFSSEEPRKKYYLFCLERNAEQDAEGIVIREKTIAEDFGEAMVEGTLEGAAPLVMLFMAPFVFADMVQHLANPPQSRPFDDCCFIWIEEWDTRRVVAGRYPGKNYLVKRDDVAPNAATPAFPSVDGPAPVESARYHDFTPAQIRAYCAQSWETRIGASGRTEYNPCFRREVFQ